MPLTLGESYALYLLLTTKSELGERLKNAASANADDFVKELSHETVLLRQGKLKPDVPGKLDAGFTEEERTSLVGLWQGLSPNNATIFNQDANDVLAALKALGPKYSGGACPKAGEQLRIWKLSTALWDTPNDPTT